MTTLAILALLLVPTGAPAVADPILDDDVEALRNKVEELEKSLREERVLRRALEDRLEEVLEILEKHGDLLEELAGRDRRRAGSGERGDVVREEPRREPPPPDEPAPRAPERPERPEPTIEQRQRAAMLYQRAEQLVSRGEYEAAIGEFEKALEILPENPSIHDRMGTVLQEMEEEEAAEGHFRKAEAGYDAVLRRSPEDFETLYNRGRVRNQIGKYDEAIRDFDRVEEAIRGSGRAEQMGGFVWGVYFNRAFSYFYQEKWEPAIADFLKSTKIDPDYGGNAVSFYNVACAYALQGKKDEALRYLKRSVEKGFDQFEHMENDEDLEILHDDPRFLEIIGKAREI